MCLGKCSSFSCFPTPFSSPRWDLGDGSTPMPWCWRDARHPSTATLDCDYSFLAFSIMVLDCLVVTVLMESSNEVLTEVCSWQYEVCIITWLSYCLDFCFNSFPSQVLLVLKTTSIFNYIYFLTSGLGILHPHPLQESSYALPWLHSWKVQQFTPCFPYFTG